MSYTFRGSVLPDDFKETIDLYVEHGIPTGGFLEACIENDLCSAVAQASQDSLSAIPAIVGYLYNEVPNGCWGRKGVFREWIAAKHAEREAGVSK